VVDLVVAAGDVASDTVVDVDERANRL